MDNTIIAVVIVNYCTEKLVRQAIESLKSEREEHPGIHVVVVDNASPDNSYESLSTFVTGSNCGSWVKVIGAERNGGFSFGNNLGFKTASAWLEKVDYFWMLNPDIEVLPGATSPLLEQVRKMPRTIAGSCLQDRDGTKQVSAFNYPSILSELGSGFSLGLLDKIISQHRVNRPIPTEKERCDWLAGASLLFSREVFEEMGEMDETYFLYYEEVDYLLAARSKGIDCWYIPSSRVIHEVGAATGISDSRKKQPRKPKYWFESRRRYFLKNHGRSYCFLADLGWVIGYSIYSLRKKLTNPDELALKPPHFLMDFLGASQLNPKNWSKGV